MTAVEIMSVTKLPPFNVTSSKWNLISLSLIILLINLCAILIGTTSYLYVKFGNQQEEVKLLMQKVKTIEAQLLEYSDYTSDDFTEDYYEPDLREYDSNDASNDYLDDFFTYFNGTNPFYDAKNLTKDFRHLMRSKRRAYSKDEPNNNDTQNEDQIAKHETTSNTTPSVYKKKLNLKSLDEESEVTSPHKTQRYKQKHNKHNQRLETLDEPQISIIKPSRKHTIAVHFSGDSSKYIQGQHANFNGNGHMRHLDQTYADWKARDWVQNLNMDQHFRMDKGVLTIKEPGIYLIYTQIYYLDMHDLNGYMVYKNGHPILQCTTMTHSKEPVMKSNTCYTAGVEHLLEDDRISVRDLSDGRYSLFENEKSFFGAVKLGDTKNK